MHASLRFLTGGNGERLFRHDFVNESHAWIAAFSHDPLHQVALREDTDEFAITENRYSSDVVVHHGLRDSQNRLFRTCEIGFLTLNQVANKHFNTPGPSF